jgi:S-adenosylmethionine decarboxylase
MKKSSCNFGSHLMIDGYGGSPAKLNDKERIVKCLNELPDKLKMTKIIKPVIKYFKGNDKKDPGGYSGFVMIAESHISIHTFPQKKFVSIDAYTCSDQIDKEFVTSYFTKKFGLKELEINYIERGTKYPIDIL